MLRDTGMIGVELHLNNQPNERRRKWRKACFKLLAVLGMVMLMLLPVTTVGAKDLSGDLEIFPWSGRRGPALEALIKLYKGRHPNVNVINATVTGGRASTPRLF